MTTQTENETVHTILSLARQLPTARRQWVGELLRRESDTPLPEQATLDEAITLYLLEACSLGRAAELAGVTRWDLQDRLQELGISLSIAGEQSAHELDDLAEQLEREGVV